MRNNESSKNKKTILTQKKQPKQKSFNLKNSYQQCKNNLKTKLDKFSNGKRSEDKTRLNRRRNLNNKTNNKNGGLKLKSHFFSKLDKISSRTKIITGSVIALALTALIVGKTIDGSIPNFVGSLSLTVQDVADNVVRTVGGAFGARFAPKNYQGSIKSLTQEELKQVSDEGKAILGDIEDNEDKNKNTADKDKINNAVEFYSTRANDNLNQGEDKIAYQILSEGYNELYKRKYYESAIALLDKIDITRFKPVTQNALYLCYYRAYDALDNKAKAEEYNNKAKEAKKNYEK